MLLFFAFFFTSISKINDQKNVRIRIYVMINLATAKFIHTIAEQRNRNWQWAEDAVRNSVSITENEALKEKIIDAIAFDTEDLLSKTDGMVVTLNKGKATLRTKGAAVQYLEMGWAEKI